MGSFSIFNVITTWFITPVSPLCWGFLRYHSTYGQTYYGLIIYTFVAAALCSVLALLAYIFSLSSVQDSEKRSEYECGFEPFDSATRLPFDVHFYLVGILFLIFDVEIALLFPWVLGLRASGWFGFYLMLGFILILAVGFLYEWKRGALIWPNRQKEVGFVTAGSITASANTELFATEESQIEFVRLIMREVINVPEKPAPAPTVASELLALLNDTTSMLLLPLLLAGAVIFLTGGAGGGGGMEGGPIHIKNYWKDKHQARTRSTKKLVLAGVDKKKVKKKPLIKKLSSCVNTQISVAAYSQFQNMPTVSKRAPALSLRLCKGIQRAYQRLERWKLLRPMNYLSGLRAIEVGLARFKAAINAQLTLLLHRAVRARNILFTDIQHIKKIEETTTDSLAVVIAEYQKIEGLQHRLQQNFSKRRFSRRKTRAGKQGLQVINTYIAAANQKFNAKRRRGRTSRLREQKTIRGTWQKRASPRLKGRSGKPARRQMGAKKAAPTARRLTGLFAIINFDVDNVVTPDLATQFFTTFLPEMFLTLVIVLILVLTSIGLGKGRQKKGMVISAVKAFDHAMLFMLFIYFYQLFTITSETLFNGYLVSSAYVIALKILGVYSGRFILVNSSKWIRAHRKSMLEYPLVLTLAVLFMTLLISSAHIVSAFIALVGLSLNLYVLILFDAASASAREAGIKYYYLSTASSGLMIYGILLIFFMLTTGNFVEIGHTLATNAELVRITAKLFFIAVVFLLFGLFFKLSAFPGHLWAADVYEGSPNVVTAFFMLPVKVAVLAFVLQLLVTAFEPVMVLWQPLVLASAVLSLLWGCIAAVSERNTKRFLAYASINQIGFLLIGLASGSVEGYRATLFYLFLYALMNMGFLIVFLNTQSTRGDALRYLTDFSGFGYHNKRYSWVIAIVLLSMAGIPPLAGFFGKYFLMLHATEQQLYGLVAVGLATSLVSTYYYLRLIKIMWFEQGEISRPMSCLLQLEQRWTLLGVEWLLWSAVFIGGFCIINIGEFINSLLVSSDYIAAGITPQPPTRIVFFTSDYENPMKYVSRQTKGETPAGLNMLARFFYDYYPGETGAALAWSILVLMLCLGGYAPVGVLLSVLYPLMYWLGYDLEAGAQSIEEINSAVDSYTRSMQPQGMYLRPGWTKGLAIKTKEVIVILQERGFSLREIHAHAWVYIEEQVLRARRLRQ